MSGQACASPPACASSGSPPVARWCPRTGDNVSFIKLATDSLEGETMLLMFWLYINEQPGQGALAKKATKWESHQYQTELCTLKVWMMLGERSLLHKGSNGNLFDVGWLQAPLDFRTSKLTTSLLARTARRGLGDMLLARNAQHTCGEVGVWGGGHL